MNLIYGADASIPDSPFPYPTDPVNGGTPRVAAGYVGVPGLPDPPDTPHIWTAEEWNRLIPQRNGEPDDAFRLLPMYVHDFPADPGGCAANMCDAIEALGWTPGKGRLLVLDIETLVAPSWVASVHAAVRDRGFRMLTYGSYSFLVQNPECDGRFPALLTRRRPTVLPPGTVAQQWYWGPHWDLDVFSDYVWRNAGRGFRHTGSSASVGVVSETPIT